MSFIKVGDLNPITIVDPLDQIDTETVKTSLKKAIKTVKDKQKEIPAPVKKESEKK